MDVGTVIKNYRKENKLTIKEFAARCDLTFGYISMLERNVNSKTGKPVTISIDSCVAIAKAMNISLMKLMSMFNENQPICWNDIKREIESNK